MKPLRTAGTALVMGALLIALAGCEKEEGPAEQAGKEIDKAVEQASEQTDDAMEQVGKQFEQAGEDIQDAAKDDERSK